MNGSLPPPATAIIDSNQQFLKHNNILLADKIESIPYCIEVTVHRGMQEDVTTLEPVSVHQRFIFA
jgi:hypothetical protein